jgi:hypothetical protein
MADRKTLAAESWVWVIVQGPEAAPQYMGQVDETSKDAFIPAFYSKEDAQLFLGRLASSRDKTSEVQAVCLADLSRDASENGFLIVMLDAGGRLLEKIVPAGDQC